MKLRKLLAFVMATVLLCGVGAVYAAADEPAPCLNNTVEVGTTSGIDDNGLFQVTFDYTGDPELFTKATITAYIEKRTLGLFWSRVDIGRTDNQWQDTCYYYMGHGNYRHQLESRGTYRVTLTYKIYGTGGAPDEIPYERTLTY